MTWPTANCRWELSLADDGDFPLVRGFVTIGLRWDKGGVAGR